jgi:hypothetical protein
LSCIGICIVNKLWTEVQDQSTTSSWNLQAEIDRIQGCVGWFTQTTEEKLNIRGRSRLQSIRRDGALEYVIEKDTAISTHTDAILHSKPWRQGSSVVIDAF